MAPRWGTLLALSMDASYGVTTADLQHKLAPHSGSTPHHSPHSHRTPSSVCVCFSRRPPPRSDLLCPTDFPPSVAYRSWPSPASSSLFLDFASPAHSITIDACDIDHHQVRPAIQPPPTNATLKTTISTPQPTDIVLHPRRCGTQHLCSATVRGLCWGRSIRPQKPLTNGFLSRRTASLQPPVRRGLVSLALSSR